MSSKIFFPFSFSFHQIFHLLFISPSQTFILSFSFCPISSVLTFCSHSPPSVPRLSILNLLHDLPSLNGSRYKNSFGSRQNFRIRMFQPRWISAQWHETRNKATELRVWFPIILTKFLGDLSTGTIKSYFRGTMFGQVRFKLTLFTIRGSMWYCKKD